jgi:ethanolamine ammonia-lyase large subunit
LSLERGTLGDDVMYFETGQVSALVAYGRRSVQVKVVVGGVCKLEIALANMLNKTGPRG